MKARVFYSDKIEYYDLGNESETKRNNLFHTQKTSWNKVAEEPNPLGFIPIIHLKNDFNNLEYGVSDLQPATSIQNAINKTVTDMLYVMDTQSFQRIVLFGSTGSGELNTSPGLITTVPNESAHLQVISNENISPFLQQIETLIDNLSAVTSIPRLTYTRSYSIPFSGFALKIMTYPLDRKCVSKQIALNDALKKLNKMIFQTIYVISLKEAETKNDPSLVIDMRDAKTDIKFNGGLPTDEISQIQIDSMELQNRLRSRYSIMENRGIESPMEEMYRIQQETIQDLMLQYGIMQQQQAQQAHNPDKQARAESKPNTKVE